MFTKYGRQARAVLDALLAKYQDEGVLNLDDPNVLQIAPFDALGTPVATHQGVRRHARTSSSAVHELQSALYQEAA